MSFTRTVPSGVPLLRQSSPPNDGSRAEKYATPEEAEYVGLKDIRGVTVQSFPTDDSPARKAGLEQGDVIVSIDGQPVEYGQPLFLIDPRPLDSAVADAQAGRAILHRTFFSLQLRASTPRPARHATSAAVMPCAFSRSGCSAISTSRSTPPTPRSCSPSVDAQAAR